MSTHLQDVDKQSLLGTTVLYGGSFNPPHMGHQLSCLYLLEALGAVSVWLIPTFLHAFSKALLPYDVRHHMCALMAQPFGEKVKVVDVERQMGGVSRTFDTVVRLEKDFHDRPFALAVGADVLNDTARWYRWAELTARLPLVVLGRGGTSGRLTTPLAMPEVSSSDVRQRVSDGASIAGLVPRAIAQYISQEGLYKAIA